MQRNGQLIGAGRTTRLISRRLRRALEHRQRTCAVPGCGATRGLHAHHLRHWEDGGPPSWPTWYCCAHITTAATTAASSPSPDPLTL
ncbi:hypothetical protein I547_4950 [Mycobacterium kansasii 824]|nr:hypothetical protein I547_4950 [Mycobacterium kansasii 824]